MWVSYQKEGYYGEAFMQISTRGHWILDTKPSVSKEGKNHLKPETSQSHQPLDSAYTPLTLQKMQQPYSG